MCECSKLSDLFKLASRPTIESEAKRVDDGVWYALHRCTSCGQNWRIDHPDQGQVQFVVRIAADASNWQEFDSEQFHKQFLLTNRGGTTDELCIYKDCKDFRVKGEVYCLNHLYSVGVRE